MSRLHTISTVLTAVGLLFSCGGGGGSNQLPDGLWEEDLPLAWDFMNPKDTKEDTGVDNVNPPDQADDESDVASPPDTVDQIGDANIPDAPVDEVSQPDETDTDANPGSPTIRTLQMGEDSLTCSVPFGTLMIKANVLIENAVVTAHPVSYLDGGEGFEGFYAMDIGPGGAYTGIFVKYPIVDLPKVGPGALVQIYGHYKEARCTSVIVLESLVVQDFYGPEPEPFVATPADIMANAESFEGSLVKLEGVTVANANPDEADYFDFGQFEVEDGLRVGNDYMLPYMHPVTGQRKVGDKFNHIIGVVRYDHGHWVVMPRLKKDMWLEGTEFPEDEPEIVIPEDEPDVQMDVPDQVDPDIVVPPDTKPDTNPPDIVPDIPDPDTGGDILVPPEADSPIVVTEIMYDPVVLADDKGEWFEIYNTTDEPIDLNGWRFTGTDGNSFMMYGTFVISPGQYMVFGCNYSESTNGGVEVNYLYPYADFVLNNESDSIIVKDMWGQIVDRVEFSELAGWPEGKGASIELIHPNLNNNDKANWKVSTVPYGDQSNKGTPGE